MPIEIIKTFWFGAFLDGVIREGDYNIKVATYSSDTESSFIRVVSSGINKHTFSFSDNEKYFRIGVTRNDFNVAMNYPTTANDYEPYNSAKTNINWQSVAGTIANGTIAPLTGGLLKNEIILTLNGTESWIENGSGNEKLFYLSLSVEQIYMDSDEDSISSHFKSENITVSNDLIGFRCYYSTATHTQRLNIRPQDVASTSLTDFKNWLVSQNTLGTPVQITIKLATPITYQLTPTEVRSLLGVNNVWADCGSITELKYTRDLNLCINDIIARIEALESGSSNRSLSLSPTLTKSIVSDSDTAEGKAEEETEEETKEEAQNER